MSSPVEWLKYRANGSFSSTNETEDENTLIFDLEAEKSTSSGPAWEFACCADKSVHSCNYTQNEEDQLEDTSPIVEVRVVVMPFTRSPFINVVHQIACNKSPKQHESLVLPFQQMEHRINVEINSNVSLHQMEIVARNVSPLTKPNIRWNSMVEKCM